MNERTILKWFLKIQSERLWNGFIWLRIGTGEHGNEPTGCLEFLV
jgi:hypothetical protein